jgi:hypothetical protein
MVRRIFVLIGCTFHLASFCMGQLTPTVDSSHNLTLILSCQDNFRWLDSLKAVKLSKQVELIKQRVISDTNVYVPPLPLDRVIRNVHTHRDRIKGCCKPLWILGSFLVRFDEEKPKSDLITFIQVIDQIEIDSIYAYTGQEKEIQAIYGSEAACGLVVMAIKDKRSSKIVKKSYGRRKKILF